MKASERQLQIRAALEEIRAGNAGRITEDLVIEKARTDDRLHGEFQWDKDKAAMAHWRERARELITRYVTITVIHRNEKITVPMYVRDPTAESRQQGHVSIEAVQADDARAVVIAEMDRCAACIHRARGVASYLDQRFPGLADEFEDLLQRIAYFRQTVNPSPPPPPPRHPATGGSRKGSAKAKPRPKAARKKRARG